MDRAQQTRELEQDWAENARWRGITRDYSAADVVRLRGSVQVEYTLARLGAGKLWRLVNQDEPLCALGALTGNQAIQEIQAGLKAIYCSGWQVAGDDSGSSESTTRSTGRPAARVPVTPSERRTNAPPVVYMARASVGDTAWDGATPSRSVAAQGGSGHQPPSAPSPAASTTTPGRPVRWPGAQLVAPDAGRGLGRAPGRCRDGDLPRRRGLATSGRRPGHGDDPRRVGRRGRLSFGLPGLAERP